MRYAEDERTQSFLYGGGGAYTYTICVVKNIDFSHSVTRPSPTWNFCMGKNVNPAPAVIIKIFLDRVWEMQE